MKKVGIIGGAGFIGSHTTKKFLNEGYKVRVSATDISNSEKYKHLNELQNSENLELLPLKVENKQQLTNFVNGCDIVIHNGTPFQLDFKDAQTELFDPTIKGTENFLEVVSETPNIEKVVFVASVAALNTNFPLPPDDKSPDDILDERSSPFISEESHPYAQAKFIANQTVEKYIKDNPNSKFEITTVSPVAVMGKSLSNREDSTSSGLQYLVKNMIAPNPFLQALYDMDAEFAIVDVKDVADGIYSASTKNGLHGKNYLLTCESCRISDMSAMLNNKEPDRAARVIYKNDAAKQDLGINFNPAVMPLSDFSK